MIHFSATLLFDEMIRLICALYFSMSFRVIPTTASCKMLIKASYQKCKKLSPQFFSNTNRSEARGRLFICRSIEMCCEVAHCRLFLLEITTDAARQCHRLHCFSKATRRAATNAATRLHWDNPCLPVCRLKQFSSYEKIYTSVYFLSFSSWRMEKRDKKSVSSRRSFFFRFAIGKCCCLLLGLALLASDCSIVEAV